MKKLDPCEFCDGKQVRQRVRTSFDFQGKTIYVDNVPAWVCTKCGEKYFDAPVYKRLELIARNRNRIGRTVRFPLAEFDMALRTS